jgi:outer membrane biosynthesis protein TonB
MEDGKISFTPIEPEVEEVSFASVELEIAEIEINLPDPEPEIVEVETEVEMELEMEMEEVLVVEAEPEEEITEEPQEESQESEQEQPQTTQKEEDSEETVEEEKPSEPKVSKKEKAATKIVKKIDDKARYDDAAQTKTLIVMQILGNTKTFFDSQSFIQDTNVTEYLNKTIDDQYGMLFDMAQNETMNDMVNSQWQKSR